MNVLPEAWYQRLKKITSKPGPDVSDIPELVSLCAAISTDATDDPESEGELIEGLLRMIGEAAIPALIPFVKAEKSEIRSAALYMLTIFEQTDNPAIAEAARAALDDENEIVRENALTTFASVADENDLDIVFDRLKPGSWAAHHILGILNRMGSNKAIPGLTRLLNFEGSSVTASEVIDTLERIGTPEAIKVVEGWMASPKGSQFIEYLITMRIDGLRQGWMLSMWKAPFLFPRPLGDRFTLYEFAIFQTLLRMLDMPDLSAKAVEVLQQLDHPDAKRVLCERGL